MNIKADILRFVVNSYTYRWRPVNNKQQYTGWTKKLTYLSVNNLATVSGRKACYMSSIRILFQAIFIHHTIKYKHFVAKQYRKRLATN